MLHAIAVIPMTTSPITAVFAFQLAGCPYHPPAGDQTCLGYLETGKPVEQNGVSKSHWIVKRWHYLRYFSSTRMRNRSPFGLDRLDRVVLLHCAL